MAKTKRKKLSPLASYLLNKLRSSRVSDIKHFALTLTTVRSQVTELLPDKENLTTQLFKRCVLLLFLIRKSKQPTANKIISTLESLPKSNWTICLGKLKPCETVLPNTLHMEFFKTLVLELISKEKAYKPFWTPAYSTISEKLSL